MLLRRAQGSGCRSGTFIKEIESLHGRIVNLLCVGEDPLFGFKTLVLTRLEFGLFSFALLKIPEVLSIKCGKRIDPELDWPFFIAIDFESMDKYGIFREDSIFVKFNEEIIKPNTEDSLVLDFEMDPGKDVQFS